MDLTPATPAVLDARGVDPAKFAIGDAVPARAVRPADRDELCEIVRACAREALAIVPWGGGTACGHGDAPERYDVAIDLTALDRVIEYEPGDLTLTAECGVRLATLRERLGDHDQELPLEAPHAAAATLGGVLAANASGPRRLRFGGPRDRILGARFVLGDGTLARTGGKVVKNVAGYGIHRLLCGSRGGLAILVDASLKLAPAPETRLAMIWALDAAALADDARWTPFVREEPAVHTFVGAARATGLPGARTGAVWCVVGWEDDAARVTQLRAAARDRLGAPALELRDHDAEALWQALADREAEAGGHGFTSPHRVPGALPGLEILDEGLFHAACGRLAVPAARSGDPLARQELREAGFVPLGAGTDGANGGGPVRVLRLAIRVALDPERRFALGGNWERGSG